MLFCFVRFSSVRCCRIVNAVLFCGCFSSVRCCRIVNAVLFCVCFSSVRCCWIIFLLFCFVFVLVQ